MRASASVVAVATLCLLASTTTGQSFCPGNGGAYYWNQNESGTVNPGATDQWFMSPCTLAVPMGHSDSVYMVIRSMSDGQVRIPYTEFDTAWHQLEEGQGPLQYEAKLYAPEYSVWVHVTVTCDPSMSLGVVKPNGNATSTVHGGACYRVPIKMNCGGSGTNAPITAAPADCSQYSGCHSCTNSNSGTCGWCANSLTCEGGTSSGPNAGNCPNSWEWVTSQCTTPVPPTPVPTTVAPVTPAPANCGQYTTCSDCTNSNSGTCGFCGATKQCESGTSNGPNMGTCPNWRWVSNQCN